MNFKRTFFSETQLANNFKIKHKCHRPLVLNQTNLAEQKKSNECSELPATCSILVPGNEVKFYGQIVRTESPLIRFP